MKHQKEQFEQIYNINYTKIFRLCQGYTNGNEALSKDLVQEVFIKVWQNIQTFRNDSNLSTWIYKITVNTCLLELRKKKTIPIAEHLKHLNNTEDTTIDKEFQLLQLHKCISKLNIENKTIILLVLEGLPQKEIAEIMGLSHEAVRIRIHRIKNELTKCVKK